MFDKFSEAARRALFFSRYESSRAGQSIIGTEHLLLGILRERDVITTELWRNVHIDPDAVRARFPIIHEHVSSSAELPISENVKKVLAYACHESDSRNDKEVEPFHLALAILRVPRCRAAILLGEYGLEYDVASEILRVLVPHIRKQTEIDERTPITLRQSHYELLDQLARTAGLSDTPGANRQRLALAIMDALLATGITEDFVKQLRAKLI